MQLNSQTKARNTHTGSESYSSYSSKSLRVFIVLKVLWFLKFLIAHLILKLLESGVWDEIVFEAKAVCFDGNVASANYSEARADVRDDLRETPELA